MLEEKLLKQIDSFLYDHTNKYSYSRQHVAFKGDCVSLMLRDTKRYNPCTKKEEWTIDIVRVSVSFEKQNKGYFTLLLNHLITKMKELGFWKCLYIESIISTRFLMHFMKRKDIIYAYYHGHSIWIEFDRTEPFIVLDKDRDYQQEMQNETQCEKEDEFYDDCKEEDEDIDTL